MRLSDTIIIALLVSALAGCSSLSDPDCVGSVGEQIQSVNCNAQPVSNTKPEVSLGVISYRPDTLIATDFINALTQLQPFDSMEYSFKFPTANSPFMEALEQVVVDRGYQVERAEQRTGKRVVMASVVKKSGFDSQYTYIVAIDRVALKRDYFVGENRMVAPVSSLFVRGASPDLIQLNDGLFVAR